MADTPRIKVTGAGTRREAVRLGQTISDGIASALAGHDGPMHVDALRLQLPVGATQAEIDRVSRRAIARHAKGSQR